MLLQRMFVETVLPIIINLSGTNIPLISPPENLYLHDLEVAFNSLGTVALLAAR